MKHFAPPPAPATSVTRRKGKLRGWFFGKGEAAGDDGVVVAVPAPEPVSEAEMLAGMIREACAAVAGTAHLIRTSGDDARAYREALEGEAGRLDEGLPPEEMVRRLVSLTQAMVERTHYAEAQLQSMSADMAVLETTLAEVRVQAEHDSLTGLLNRGAITARLSDAMERVAGTRAALSVAYCDIDHFKGINDRYGHDVGDRVLRMVASTLSDHIGADGVVGRQGGEEFVVVLEDAPAAVALRRIDAIRQALAERSFRSSTTGETIGHITFSAGVAEWDEREGETDLLGRADAALYRAKSEGRNRVIEG